MLFIRANTPFNICTLSIQYHHLPVCISACPSMHTSPSGLLSIFLPVDAQTTTQPPLWHPCIGSWGCYVHHWNGHAGLCLPPAHWLHAACLQMQHCHQFYFCTKPC